MRLFTNKRNTFISTTSQNLIPGNQELILYADFTDKENIKFWDQFKPWKGSEVVTVYELPEGGYTEDIFDDRVIMEEAKEVNFLRTWDQGMIVRMEKITSPTVIYELEYCNKMFIGHEIIEK